MKNTGKTPKNWRKWEYPKTIISISDALGRTAIVRAPPIKYQFVPKWDNPTGSAHFTTRSFLQNVNIYHRVGTMQRFFGPGDDEWKRSDYDLEEKTTWSSADKYSCYSEVILPSDPDFGYTLKENNDGGKIPYPLTPDLYFKYSELFNTTWTETLDFEKYETCYQAKMISKYKKKTIVCSV